MVDIKAIKARMDKATPGPWRWTTHGADILLSDSEDVLGPVMSGVEVISSPETAEFIANSRSDVLKLVAEVAKLRGLLGITHTGFTTLPKGTLPGESFIKKIREALEE